MVAFHKEFRVSPIITGEITFTNKIPETWGSGCLCNGMKTPDHEQKLHLDGTAKPGIQKPLDCYGGLRHLCSRPRQRRDLDDEYFYGVAILDFAHVNGSVATILPIHPARRRTRRQSRPSEVDMLCQCWVGGHGLGLAVLGWLHLLNPYLMLASVFFIGVGFAFNAPAWTSIVPQVVADAELPSAATLS
jgi:Transmembrane secretion effector